MRANHQLLTALVMLARLADDGLCQTHLDVALHIGSASAAVLTLFGQIVVVRLPEPPRSGSFCQNLGGSLCGLSCFVVFGSVQSSDPCSLWIAACRRPGHGGLGRLARLKWLLVVHEMPPPSSAPMVSFSGGSAAIYQWPFDAFLQEPRDGWQHMQQVVPVASHPGGLGACSLQLPPNS
jgi:hypothetical protein